MTGFNVLKREKGQTEKVCFFAVQILDENALSAG